MLKLKKKFRVQEQKQLIDILSEKMMLYPKIMNNHFNSLFLMKNKEQLTEYFENFISRASLVGYADCDMKKLIMALRLIHPDPKQLDKQLILDFLVMLSISDDYYKSMDAKSVKYVENMLDIIEERYSGKRIAHFDMTE